MKTILISLILSFAIFTGGCQTTKISTNVVFEKIAIPASVTVCNPITKKDIPSNIGSMTNQQVNNFILKLYKNNQICSANMKAVRKFIADYNKNIDAINKSQKNK